jgi:integrase
LSWRIYNLAIEWERATKNPAKDMEFITEPKQLIRFLNEEEASLLLSACTWQSQRLFVLIGLHAGFRYKEILGLKWSNVDLQDRLLIIRESKNNNAAEVPLTMDLFDALCSATRYGESVISKEDG